MGRGNGEMEWSRKKDQHDDRDSVVGVNRAHLRSGSVARKINHNMQ